MIHKIAIHGHRGARGLFPENTLAAFIGAIQLGVDAIELDVVISKDEQVVVSHEEWMNDLFCLTPSGNPIKKNAQEKYNLYHMNYEEIALYDCGTKQHPDFPFQKTEKTHKPLLYEVIQQVEKYILENQLKPIIYNIEIKSEIAHDHIFQPTPHKIVDLVLNSLREFNLPSYRYLIQSFDVRILQLLHPLRTHIPLGLLVENTTDYKAQLIHLGFKPDFYNPESILVTSDLIEYMHQQHIKVIPWTVNTNTEMINLIGLGVDGLITDYPDIAIKLIS